jgi:DNA invertase Pin-like site-specific DNA recombinase
MATEAFKGISFALPDAGKLKAAEELGRRCGERWYAEWPEALPIGFPGEVKDWTEPCRAAWRGGLVEGWHAAKREAEKAAAAASGGGALVGYARVSTQDQDTALQINALKAAGCTKIFAEKASGAQRERPQLAAALDSMRPGDTLVVWKLDRLARSMKQLVETVEDLAARRIGFRSLTEAMDTTTAGGTLIFNVFASLAAFERTILRERTRAGLDADRARGRVGGRPAALNERDLQEARALLKDPSITFEQVAKRLGVGASTLYRHLPGGRGGV